MTDIMHIHDHKNTYDVIMVDSTEPVGPAVQLFNAGSTKASTMR